MRRLVLIASVLALVGVAIVAVARVSAVAIENGLAPTPPMGWNGYNHFSHDVTAALVEAEARTIVSSGMQAAGYQYVNLDGGWNLLQRTPDGQLQPDPVKFPDGIKPVADYVHSLGLKFGIYASAGTTNCAVTSAGSYGHYQQDADTFASWGVDYVKLDRCAVPYDNYPDLTHPQVTELLATQMHEAMVATGRPMVFDVNDAMQAEHDWTWAPPIANMWRMAGDIADTYSSMVNHFTADITNSANTAAGGGWNDPDMLEVGNGGMTDTEDRSQFSLWAELAAPLIAGNDLGTMSSATQAILTNREVIAVDQDPLGKQGYPIASADGHWVLTKALANGDRAVVLFNQTNTPALISTSTHDVGLPDVPAYAVRDLWTHSTSETAGPIREYVPAHAVAMYRLSAQPEAAGLYAPRTLLSLSASSPVVPASGSTTVTAKLSDDGLVGLENVGVQLQLPNGWAATPSGPITFPQVPGRRSVQASWRVTAPSDTPPGTAMVAGHAGYTAGPRQGTAGADLGLVVPYPSLAAAFNNAGISDDSDVTTANFDGVGNSYSAQTLAAAGLTPGSQIAYHGAQLTWPTVSAGEPDNVVAQGQAIPVSGSGTSLAFVGAGSPDSGGQGTVYYADGTTSSYAVTLDNYFSAPDTGNDIIAVLPYVNDSNPASNGGVAGRRNHTAYIFAATVAITPGKQVLAVTLPTGGTIPTTGRINGMHLFALGVGG